MSYLFRTVWVTGLLLLLPNLQAGAQVLVSGVVKDRESDNPIPYAFVVNHRTQNGTFCDQQGRFLVNVQPNDSLLFSHIGYQFTKVLLSDSVRRDVYRLSIYLTVKPVQLKSFTVKAPKTFEQILRDLETAEQSKVRNEMPVADAISSPITFLYMQFSREGKAMRKISELRAEDAKRELLRELFTRYMLAHIINIDENDMDDFIGFSGLSNNYDKFDTEYALVVHVKERFAAWKKYRGIRE